MEPALRLRTVLAFVACALVCSAGAAQAGSLVRFQTSLGSFDVELYDQHTPLSVANFLAHIGKGDYTNSLVHRSARTGTTPQRPFVIQGGGYRLDAEAREEPSGYPTTPSCPGAPTVCPVPNEPVFPFPRNTRGTIAMAKLSNQANSATNQWFINLSSNNVFVLDTQSGGFTTFGRVVGNGMTVVDAIAALPTFAFTGAWVEAPMRNYDARGFDAFEKVDGDNVVVISSVTVLPDGDTDGIPNAADRCPFVNDPGQANADGDAAGDACDNCPNLTNADQTDFDADGIGDVCDSCPTVVNENSDPDMDGVDQACDTCLLQANPVVATATGRSRISGQFDDDVDGRGNACDFDYDQSGGSVTSADIAQIEISVGKAVTLATCGSAPTNQRCGEFDHDSDGGSVDTDDVNLAKAALSKVISTSFPACAACSVGAGWGGAVTSPNPRLGRPICDSQIGACPYAP